MAHYIKETETGDVFIEVDIENNPNKIVIGPILPTLKEKRWLTPDEAIAVYGYTDAIMSNSPSPVWTPDGN